jgi:uncharacterized membrane protein YgcG
MFGLVYIMKLYEDKRRKDYAIVASQLNEIDMARAAALQGTFQCKSCPICLENFKLPPLLPPPANVEPQSILDRPPSEKSDTVDSCKMDTKNEKVEESQRLLESTRNDDTIPCILTASEQEKQDQSETLPTSTSTTTTRMFGSDNLPLKLLRCGHVFDTACWEEWISSGRGNVNKCPICQQDVGIAGSSIVSTTFIDGNNNSNVNRRGDTIVVSRRMNNREHNSITPTTVDNIHPTDTVSESTSSNISGVPSLDTPTLHPSDNTFSDSETSSSSSSLLSDQARALRQYTRDRNFRLVRLAARYPQYIQPQQIQRWTQPNYDGQLARDPSFVENDPTRIVQQQHRSNNRNGDSIRGNQSPFGNRSGGSGFSGSGFSGGSSGGGRGSTW